MRHQAERFFRVVGLVIVLSSVVLAQTGTSSITGTVMDASTGAIQAWTSR